MGNNLILDTDFLFGLFFQDDANHRKSTYISSKIATKNIYISNLVIYELLTLVSKRVDQHIAKTILEDISNMQLQVLYVTREEEGGLFESFLSFDKKNISIVDCANLVLAKKFKAKVVSFDKFYPKEYLFRSTLS